MQRAREQRALTPTATHSHCPTPNYVPLAAPQSSLAAAIAEIPGENTKKKKRAVSLALSASGLGGRVCTACGGKFDAVEDAALDKTRMRLYHADCAASAPAPSRIANVVAVPPASFAACV